MEDMDNFHGEVLELKGRSESKRLNKTVDGPDRGYNRSNIKCWNCERFGHIKNECKVPKNILFPRSVVYYQPLVSSNANKAERGSPSHSDQINSRNPQPMQTCYTMLTVANGGTMDVFGKRKTTVTIQHKHLAVEFVVAEDALQDSLACIDFLQQYAGTINKADRSCTHMGQRFSLISSDDGAQLQHVVLDKNKIIPSIPGSGQPAILCL
ncbi:hypothetical protein XELAEV_18004569mg [Xenopus laevis]|uniref:CCHC-type domain-containing protein n=1 Tax=Xenopus laevis TaxID=8355 RepID=A0A974BQX0_XENLA|nr:hypothetical protein XELAEV_18004569mg [Xenopus laevis]